MKQGEEAVLWFDARKLQLFDEESGRSLLGNGSNVAAPPPPQQTAPGG